MYRCGSDNMKKFFKNKRFLLLLFCFFIIGSVGSFFACMALSPKIEVEDEEIVLNVGDKFVEPSYKAYAFNKNITGDVKKTGSVKEEKIGTYVLEYDVEYSIFESKKKVVVSVVDKEKPVINLVGGENVLVCPGKVYEEQGYSALDNYDGDITSSVKVVKSNSKIEYRVSDSSSNETKVFRNIEEVDREKPVITLKGKDSITLYVGDAYNESGYEVVDNCDGDITSKVQVQGSVNTSVVGSYDINYRVVDNSNNEAVVTRSVRVINRVSVGAQSGSGRGIIYLTFDDGPNEGTTNVILDILRSEGVPATFFVTGNGPDYLIQRMYQEGHTVALHTYSHDYGYVYSSIDNYFNDLNKISNRVERITGEKSMIIRFPGGSSNTVSRHYSSGIMTRLTQEVRNRGYHYFDWNVDSNDAAGAGTDGVYYNVINNLSFNRSNVVLMHDVKSTTRDALRRVIQYAKSNGYQFGKITNDTAMVTHGVNN